MKKKIQDKINDIDNLAKEATGVDLKKRAEVHERKLFAYYNTFSGLAFNTTVNQGVIYCIKQQYKVH